jgi:hypothetical protein
MEIRSYLESGILEAYILGSASDAEVNELLELKKHYPEIQQALTHLETDMERIAQYMAVPPPPNLFARIENNLNELKTIPQDKIVIKEYPKKENGSNGTYKKGQYIEVEAESSYMRLHKGWKWVFAAVFVLGKIFLGFAIYYYLENRQAKEQIQQLKTELRQPHTP